jgi:16S rRNA (cytidine1402-2'-O)-methyltransferase
VSAPGARVAGTLHIVSTPIGNLGDLSPRAQEVLGAVAAVLAEDTRHTRKLWERFGLKTPLIALHEHNEAEATPGLVARLLGGDSLALVTDAGTPLLSDPGARLARAAIAAGVTVSPVPGASALLSALVGSGRDASRFTFFGFLERKGRARNEALAAIAELAHTAVLYEAPGRTAATLRDLEASGGGARGCAVARELTKSFEEFRRGTVSELAAYYESNEPRGEIVIVVAGGETAPLDEEALRARAATLRAEGRAAREIVQVLMEDARVPRNLTYRIAHE